MFLLRPPDFRAIKPYAVKMQQARIEPNLIRLGVDLRPRIRALDIPIRKQGDRGTCSVFAMTFLLEFGYRSKPTTLSTTLSPEFLNWAKNKAASKSKDGDFFDVIDKGYSTYGVAREEFCPYQATYNPNLKPGAQATVDGQLRKSGLKGRFLKPWSYDPATDAQLDAIRASLRKGTPVATGFRWPTDGKYKQVKVGGADVLGLIPEADVFDGHSVVTVGYVPLKAAPGGGYFIFRNSWGETWGDSGYGYMSYAYFQKFLNDAFVYE